MMYTFLRPVLMEPAGAGFVEPSISTVVFTGLTLVFAILVLLTLLLTLSGKLFAKLDNKKGETPAAAKNAPVAAGPTVQAAPPAIQEGIPPEVVAAIAAAVASIEGGKYTLRSVSTVKQGRNEWGLAGVLAYTEPF